MSAEPTPLLGFAAPSGTGKTTLLRALLPRLTAAGLRVGLIKHAHHDFDIDHPGKDSYELRKAGAERVLVTSARRWALMVERTTPADPVLEDQIARIDDGGLDMILVEGFKHAALPKIALHRTHAGPAPRWEDDPWIIAVASDGPRDTTLPRLDLNDPDGIAEFIRAWLRGRASTRDAGGS